MPIGLQTLSTLLLPDMKSWWNLPSFWWRSPLQTKLLKCTKYWPCPWHAPIWSSFLDTFWDSCSGKFPKIILSKPHYFPSSAHFKLCNSWTILATACYRPALQPRQTCQLLSPCLGGVCLTIPLAQHWMAITHAQRCLTVIIEVKTKDQTWEHLQLPFLRFRLMPWVHPGKQLMRMREESLLPRCLPSHWFQPFRAGCAVCHKDGWACCSAAPPQEPSALRIKNLLFYPR